MNNGHTFTLSGATLTVLPTGAVWWADTRTLIVSDLHLGKSDRIARRSGMMLPPYETRDTLGRLQADVDTTNAGTVICLGDSFDDTQASQSLSEDENLWITRLQAGRRWVWIEGNHDSCQAHPGGTYLSELVIEKLTFRHIAVPGQIGEISGHYHPKARLNVRGRSITRPCVLFDSSRAILPAYGTYTGGLHASDPVLRDLMQSPAFAVLIGPTLQLIPAPAV